MLRKIILPVIMICSFKLLTAQGIRSFTPDSVLFVNELQTLFDRINNPENRTRAVQSLEEFKVPWLADQFSPQQKAKIYTIANLMLARQVQPFPYFATYFGILTIFKTADHDENNINTWLDGMLYGLNKTRNSRLCISLIEFTDGFLKRKSLYDSKVSEWYCDAIQYSFHNDTTFYVSIPQTDLHCRTKNDSTMIAGTSGTFFPSENVWKGHGGRLDWRRAGIEKESTWADLDDYEIAVNTLKFSADSVLFHNKKYIKDALPGRLDEKVSTNAVTTENATYPQFESYSKDLLLPHLFRDIDYQGGFSMKGATLIGDGAKNSDAILYFKRMLPDKKEFYDFLVAHSKSFVIYPDRINAASASISIFHGEDSIYHSGLLFKYLNNDREISMLRIEKGVQQSPYFDTYHRITIDCEAVYWDMDTPEIQFRSTIGMQDTSTAVFFSDRLYSEMLFDKLQGIDMKHPLFRIRDFLKTYKTNNFFIYEMAIYLNMPETQVEAMVISLAQEGFIHYDVDTKQAWITGKVSHYIDSKNGKTDYDVISFISKVEDKDNATLDLRNFDLTIRGVPMVSLSDSQQVYIYPLKEEVILRKNRNFLFSGKIKAGLFEFIARDCSFEYDSFRLKLPTVEQMRFKVKAFKENEKGERPLVDVRTVISDLTGEILIDAPNNKNGLKYFPQYPEFHSNSPSYAYYDIDSAFKFAYNRERFRYHIKPFKIKSLESFSTDSLLLYGYLNSGGIFPDIEYPLGVQPDYSLGFQTKTPAAGYAVYEGAGKYTSDISLSLEGLRGKGTLDFLNSRSSTNNIIFYLDSARSVVDEFTINKKITSEVTFPSVTGKHLRQKWMPYQDSMIVATIDSSLMMYDNGATLSGSLALTSRELTGRGTMKFFDAEMDAGKYVFSDHSFQSDTTNFRLKTLDKAGLALKTDIYRTNIDFESKTGNFQTSGKDSKIDFPVNRYICFMDEFDWYMDRDEITFKNMPDKAIPDFDTLSYQQIIDVDLSGSEFISTNPSQDSLKFFALQANYNLRENNLTAEDVKIIRVADAAVFPGDGIVRIGKDAMIAPLEQATIIADTATKKHLITDAKVTITSRHSYKADGKVAYADSLAEPQLIHLDNIGVDKNNRTYGTGKILPEDNFRLSPYFAFRGDVLLTSQDPYLTFDGSYMILQDCSEAFSRWVNFKAMVDPDNITLPVDDEPKEFAAKRLYAAFFHSHENNRIYPAFLSRREYYSDTLMMSVAGKVKVRRNGQEFLIANAEIIDTLPDKKDPLTGYMKLKTNTCEVVANGQIRLGADLGEVRLNTFGIINHLIIPDSTLFDVVMTVDFFFAEEALNNMFQNLDMANKKGVDVTMPKLQTAYLEMVGKQETDKILSDINLTGFIKKVPDALKNSLFLSDVKLAYNKETRSYVSQGPIGVGSILGQPVNKYFEGYIEVVRKRSGDVLNIYLEADRSNWYFFSYSSNVMQAISSQTDFNAILRDVKTEKRKDEAGRDEIAYRYIISTTQKKNSFLRSMRSPESNEEE